MLKIKPFLARGTKIHSAFPLVRSMPESLEVKDREECGGK
ncbi:hypothetical protein NARC_40132 [Candidatus Nitrosocosmicus arcticus]|uniref:Uncharacterized protein n=1 Tax=Candidatus Nitrosocosmicus arcticus TaxID=2035267 RepID=A0A557SX36_9ARCH|nr:hypothetical protein NARC_40132 [Candidatus Nitrosocosmicus arcticus]